MMIWICVVDTEECLREVDTIKMKSLDVWDIIPDAMRVYLSHYGRHFSKKMYEFAVSTMRSRGGDKMEAISKQDLEQKMSLNNVEVENDILYDKNYVYTMAMSDFYGSSIIDEKHICMYVRDLCDDEDKEEGFIFNRFYADCVFMGIPIDWEDMI